MPQPWNDQGRSTVSVTGTEMPAPPSATHNWAQPWTQSTLEDTVGIARAEYDFLPAWTAYVEGGVHHAHENGTAHFPALPHPKEKGHSIPLGILVCFNQPGAAFVTHRTPLFWTGQRSQFRQYGQRHALKSMFQPARDAPRKSRKPGGVLTRSASCAAV